MAFFIVFGIFALTVVGFLRSPYGRGWLGEMIVRIMIGKTKERMQYVINNCMVSVEGKSSQIDHILINPNGIYIIETKNYSGRVYGNEHQLEWTQVLAYGRVKNKVYNPLKQNATHCYRLAEFLPDYKEYFRPAVVFVQGNIKYIDARGVFTLFDLYQYIKSASPVPLSSEQMKEIYEKIRNANDECSVTAEEHIQEIHEMLDNIDQNICPRCSGQLVLRHGTNGDFYGCSNYPKCTFTKKINR